MFKSFVKERLLDFVRNNITPRADARHSEQIYQGIFDQQCQNFGIENTFYPVGAAASYSLMYLLVRILTELPARNIIELGSGQSTLLIDKLRHNDGHHICYENNAMWAAHLQPKLERCDYRLRPLTSQEYSGKQFAGYAGLELTAFDLLLVDGPNGTDHISRFSCLPLLESNIGNDFVMIIDDADRPGEIETIAEIMQILTEKSVEFKINHLQGRTTQAVITTEKFRAASYYF